jgi:ABC-type bacteriocin/lantibiotic exporter with double-glycine peptidase domain
MNDGHFSDRYAKWSGKINREIFQHYSDGTAIATEAVSNIRTVRAVSSEAYETGKYDETMAMALRKGIKDGIFGSLSSAFNNYLDLGAGVLILWCGSRSCFTCDLGKGEPRRRALFP